MKTLASTSLSVLLWLVASTAAAQSPRSAAINSIRLEVFSRGGSELSSQAENYARELGERTRGLDVVIHDVLKDQAQLARLWKLAGDAGRDKPVVPAFYSCGRLYFGFSSAEKTGPAIESLFTAEVYTRSTCPRCQSAKVFISQLQARWPALRFRIYEITYDTAARQRYEELCRSRGQIPGLPTLYFAGQVIIGYQGDSITGAQWENLIRRVSGSADGKVGSPTTSWHRVPREPASEVQLVAWQPPPDPSGRPPPQVSDDASPADEVPPPDNWMLPEEAGADDEGEVIPAGGPPASEVPSDVIELPVFGALRARDMGLPLFTFLVGLVDGFNPCAMWVLVFLLSVLVNIKDRRKILLIAGTFVVVSGVAYFAFMAAWLNLFLLIGIARPAQIILGLMAITIGVINIKDFVAFKQGITLSIPESSKPGLYRRVREIVSARYLSAALVSVVVLAVIVNMIELLCTAGLPALYTQILTMQQLPAWQNYGYLGLYIAAYMLDDSVLLGVVVVTLSHRRLQEREGRWLKLVSGLVILALGLVMIFKPSWLQLH
jgi:hypothetical protein